MTVMSPIRRQKEGPSVVSYEYNKTQNYRNKEDVVMKKNLTELVFILDRSGSMKRLESDTVGGYNALLDKQRKEEGEAIVTTFLFDDDYELLHDRIPLTGIADITTKEYYARGFTALLDAVGRTIVKIENAQAHTLESQRPEKTLFVIITDGLENASKEYRLDAVKTMIDRCREKGWEFLFLGANMDAVKTAGAMGIAPERSVNYHADSTGTTATFSSVACAVSEMRCGVMSSKWRKEVDQDYSSRKR